MEHDLKDLIDKVEGIHSLYMDKKHSIQKEEITEQVKKVANVWN